MTVRDLDPGYFALVMATGICSTALSEVGWPTASAALLATAGTGFVVLCGALAWRVVRHPRRTLDDLGAPDRAYAFFTFVAACDVLAVRLTADGHRTLALALTALGALTWSALSYAVPARLVLGTRRGPVLAGVNGTWFVWVVGAQSVAVSAAVLDQPGTGLVAVSMWSVGVVLYLVVAALVLTRLLLFEIRAADLTPPYWVAMGATAITVLAAAELLDMTPNPALAAARPVLVGLGVVLWAFGSWLVPLLLVFGVWRRLAGRVRPGYTPALWSMVFPMGMYAVASMRLGAVADLPVVATVGRGWTPVALTVWTAVFLAMCGVLTRPALASARSAVPALAGGRTAGAASQKRPSR